MTTTEDETQTLPAWWISWYSPESFGGFALYWPWWRSGWMFTEDDQELTIFVAAVRAENEEDAYDVIAQAYEDPPTLTDDHKRFCQRIDEDDKLPWEREGTRFPLGDWMEWK